MVHTNRVHPTTPNWSEASLKQSTSSPPIVDYFHRRANGDLNDIDSISTLGPEESSYLKLKPFTKLDPALRRLLTFLSCFGLTVNFDGGRSERSRKFEGYLNLMKVTFMLLVALITGEVVYDVNLRQSKLLQEQKRSTPLLTFVIVAYSWLTLLIPVICDLSLVVIGTRLFRFYSRTKATVCNGIFFGRTIFVDSYYYYLTLVVLALLDAVGQVVVLGIWPKVFDPYVRYIVSPLVETTSFIFWESTGGGNETHRDSVTTSSVNKTYEDGSTSAVGQPKITAYLLDTLLGESYAHSDFGICVKIACLMIQFMHSHAIWIIIISLASHYATVINTVNQNLDKYEFRRLLKQLIILRDSSEQISLIVSIPFAFILVLDFVRQIALNGVFIQSSMMPYENWAVSLQSVTSSILIFMIFVYCDSLQSASKQTHRLKTEQTVTDENNACNQSMYETLDYLSRLTKSIRITFFNIISINKSSLVGLYGHILTLTFVTS